MIGRLWRGWTQHADADAFEAYVRTVMWPALFARNIPGFREISCMRLMRPGLTEFQILMRFDSIEAVKQFAGEDYQNIVLPQRGRDMLRRFETRAEHFEIREIRKA